MKHCICEHRRVIGEASTLSSGRADSDQPRLPALTGLRIIAAVAVYASHVGPPHGASKAVRALFEAGYMGVTLFFVLSGFVLAINYFETMRRPSARATWQFGVARFARIYPLYILILCYVLLRRHVYGIGVDGWWQHVLAIQAWNPSVFQAFNFNGPAWSVSVEVFLYACFPLLVLALARLRTPRALLLAGFTTAAAMAAAAGWFVLTHRSGLSWADSESAHRWLYVTPLSRLGDFVLGILAARLFLHVRDDARVVAAGRSIAIACSVAILLLMAWPADLFSAWSWDVAYAVPAVALIFGLAVAPRGSFARFLSLPLLVLLGESSYAFYLIHQPALTYFGAGRWTIGFSASTLIYEVLTFGAILCLAVGLHILVERPARLHIRRLLASDPRSPKKRAPRPA
jgi:peptidoglycan/LPS O-acetylase OafA/YrhL